MLTRSLPPLTERCAEVGRLTVRVMGRKRLSGFVTILRMSRAGCSNSTSDSTRELLGLLAREAVTLTVCEGHVRTSVAPARFSMVITLIGSLKARVNVAASRVERKAGKDKKGNDAAKRIALIIVDAMSSDLRTDKPDRRSFETGSP